MFYTSPTAGIKAISNLILIYLHLKKLYKRFFLRESFLLFNHIISSILSSNRSYIPNCYNISVDLLTPKQRLYLKSAFIDMDNKYNKLISSFSFFNKEFKPENCLIDLFSDRFSFYLCSPNIKKHIKKLDNIIFRALLNTYSSIIVSDASIKNHVITSILHIYLHNKSIIKTIHRVVNVITTEAELFAI